MEKETQKNICFMVLTGYIADIQRGHITVGTRDIILGSINKKLRPMDLDFQKLGRRSKSSSCFNFLTSHRKQSFQVLACLAS